MKTVYCGLESSGKTLILANEALKIFKRNQRWFKKYGFRRKVYSNLKFSDKITEIYKDYIVYWRDIQELIGIRGIDVIHDEISTDFSAIKRDPLPRPINQWLRQGAKQGVHYYATAQEFHDIHLDFRRRVSYCYVIRKVFGSRRGGQCFPKIKCIYGLCLYRGLDIRPYNELAPKLRGFPSPIFITRYICDVFDTHQPILISDELPLVHSERVCKVCGYKKITHR